MKIKIAESGLHKAVAEIGGTTRLAIRLGVSRQAVRKWLKRGWPPAARVVEISTECDIPRHELVDPRLADLLDKEMGE